MGADRYRGDCYQPPTLVESCREILQSSAGTCGNYRNRCDVLATSCSGLGRGSPCLCQLPDMGAFVEPWRLANRIGNRPGGFAIGNSSLDGGA